MFVMGSLAVRACAQLAHEAGTAQPGAGIAAVALGAARTRVAPGWSARTRRRTRVPSQGRWVSVQLTDGRTFDGVLDAVDGSAGASEEEAREVVLYLARERLALDARVVKPAKRVAYAASDIVCITAADIDIFDDDSAATGGPVSN